MSTDARSRESAPSALSKSLLLSLALAGVGAASAGCHGPDPRVFEPEGAIAPRLVPLQMHIMDLDTSEGGRRSLIPPDRVQESRIIVKKDFSRNIFESGAQEFGHAVLRIHREASTNWGWFFLGAPTLWIIDLFGVPLMSQTWVVSVDLQILDGGLQEVARYESVGEDTQYMAAYWGRFTPGVIENFASAYSGPQMANALALREALDGIKELLEEDAAALNGNLRQSGALGLSSNAPR